MKARIHACESYFIWVIPTSILPFLLAGKLYNLANRITD